MTAAEGAARPHIVIASCGRSGSNLVGAMFETHERTVLRNEANLKGGTFAELDAFFPQDVDRDFARKWDRAVHLAPRRNGKRDGFPAAGHKSFVRHGPLPRLVAFAEARRRLRPFIGLGAREWDRPAVLYDADAIKRALPVFKLLIVPETVRAAHAAFPDMRVVHVLRRPQDFLASWYNRYVLNSGLTPDEVLAQNRVSLPGILAHFGSDPGRATETGHAALLRSELWRWRYVNERLMEIGGPRYLLVRYETAKSDPVDTTRELFGFAGLDFTATHAARAARISNPHFSKAHARRLPDSEIDEAVACVLEGSPLADLF